MANKMWSTNFNLWCVITIAFYVHMASSQTCNSRFCLYTHQPNQSLESLEDAQDSCRKKNENSFPLEVYDDALLNLLNSLLSNNTDYWQHHVLLNLIEKTSDTWFYIDEITKTPKPLPLYINSSYDENKNYMAIFKNSDDLLFEFLPSFGHEALPTLCSFPSTEEECSMENRTSFYSNNLCHMELLGSFTWFQAQNECHLRNMSMASFINISLDSAFLNPLNHSRYWVAITRSLWYWKDSGSYAHFSYWLFDMPSQNSSQNCAYFMSQDNSNRWFRKECKNEFAIMCMTDNQRAPISAMQSGLAIGSVAGLVVGVIVITVVITTIITTIIVTKRNKMKYP